MPSALQPKQLSLHFSPNRLSVSYFSYEQITLNSELVPLAFGLHPLLYGQQFEQGPASGAVFASQVLQGCESRRLIF